MSRLLTIAAVLSVAFLLVRALLWLTALADRHPDVFAVVAALVVLAILTVLAVRTWAGMPLRGP